MNPASSKREREEITRVLIYKDAGTCCPSLSAIKEQIEQTISSKVKFADSYYLTTKRWQEKTNILVMGGGSCSSWEHSLGTKGMLAIRSFVHAGGNYLGICAGAYFAAATSCFQLQGQPPLVKYRPLAFFSGLASGPINSPQDHLAPEAAVAAKVKLAAAKGLVYYQGGCSFDITESTEHVEVLARYQKPYRGSAIIACTAGLGKAVLSGPHPEFCWKKELGTLKTAATFAHLVETLSEQELFRQEIWRLMLSRLH